MDTLLEQAKELDQLRRAAEYWKAECMILREALQVAAERLRARGHNMGADEALAVLSK